MHPWALRLPILTEPPCLPQPPPSPQSPPPNRASRIAYRNLHSFHACHACHAPQFPEPTTLGPSHTLVILRPRSRPSVPCRRRKEEEGGAARLSLAPDRPAVHEAPGPTGCHLIEESNDANEGKVTAWATCAYPQLIKAGISCIISNPTFVRPNYQPSQPHFPPPYCCT